MAHARIVQSVLICECQHNMHSCCNTTTALDLPAMACRHLAVLACAVTAEPAYSAHLYCVRALDQRGSSLGSMCRGSCAPARASDDAVVSKHCRCSRSQRRVITYATRSLHMSCRARPAQPAAKGMRTKCSPCTMQHDKSCQIICFRVLVCCIQQMGR
jgi:hypothetical protein